MNIKNQLATYIFDECLEITLTDFFKQFHVEFEHEYNLKIYPNRSIRLAEYLKGLPSNLNIPFEYYTIENLILTFNADATDKTLKRYRNYFFEIVADILIKKLD